MRLWASIVAGLALAGVAAAQTLSSGQPVAEGTMVRREELMGRQPNVETTAARTWVVEKTPEVGALLIEVVGTLPLHYHPDGAHRLYLIEGELKVRVGTRELTMRPGDYLSIPRNVRHKIQLATGQTRALLGTVDTPPVDPQKTVWLEAAPTPVPRR